jgi:hypothetical protein
MSTISGWVILMSETQGHRTTIWVAIIGAIGVLGAAALGNSAFWKSNAPVQQEGVDATQPTSASDAGSGQVAGPSTDIDAPTPFPSGGTISGVGIGQDISYYYTFVGGPGEIRLVVDGKNEDADIASAVAVTISDMDARRIIGVHIGNTTISKREVARRQVLGQQQLLMRVLLSRHTLEYKVRLEGAVEG